MRNPKARLFVFFAVETLAVAAMIGLFQASRPVVGHEFCCGWPPGSGLMLGIPAVLGELAILAAALKMKRPVWAALLVLGLCSFLTAATIFMSLVVPSATFRYGRVFVAWHLAASVLLVGVGLLGAVGAGFRRRGRSVEELRRERGIVV